jgi:glutamine amidotransferase
MNVLIDYNAGNITSLKNALDKLDAKYLVSSDPKKIQNAERVIFPGQGNIAQAKNNLIENDLVETLQSLKQPFLGICVGMQLLYESSEEGATDGLGVIPGSVKKFDQQEINKVPHMGWNKVQQIRDSPLFSRIDSDEYFYFANSYHCPANDFSLAKTEYINSFSSVCQKGNFYGTQFHPEKSAEAGLQLLKNFLSL